MTVEDVKHTGESGVLEVKCSGEHGVGSDGASSAHLLTKTVRDWIADHPESLVSVIEVDYSAVDYSWGDGPVTSMLALYPLGISKFRLVCDSANYKAFKSLLESCNMVPFFQLVRRDVTDGQAVFTPVEMAASMSSPHHQRPLDEERLQPESRDFARRLFNALPAIRRHARMEGWDEYSLVVEVESPTGDAQRQLTISVEGREPSVFFGEWHTHSNMWPSGVDDIVQLVEAILNDQFVIIINVGGQHDGLKGILDLRNPDALLEELADGHSSGRVRIKTFTGRGDQEVGLNDLK
jgi:hypothetical protein